MMNHQEANNEEKKFEIIVIGIGLEINKKIDAEQTRKVMNIILERNKGYKMTNQELKGKVKHDRT